MLEGYLIGSALEAASLQQIQLLSQQKIPLAIYDGHSIHRGTRKPTRISKEKEGPVCMF